MNKSELRQLISKIEYDIVQSLPDGISDKELEYVYIKIATDLSLKVSGWILADGNE